MTDCWLDRNGRIYYVEPYQHDSWAQDYLSSEFQMSDIDNWDNNGFSQSFENTLSLRGWARFTSTTNSWIYNPGITLSRRQLETIYDLGGTISRYAGYPFNYEEFERI